MRTPESAAVPYAPCPSSGRLQQPTPRRRSAHPFTTNACACSTRRDRYRITRGTPYATQHNPVRCSHSRAILAYPLHVPRPTHFLDTCTSLKSLTLDACTVFGIGHVWDIFASVRGGSSFRTPYNAVDPFIDPQEHGWHCGSSLSCGPNFHYLLLWSLFRRAAAIA